MTRTEFVTLTGFEPTPEEYQVIEQAYYRFDGSKTDGRLIEEYAGTVSFAVGSKSGGFSVSLMQDSDRRYATGSVDFYSDEVLDISKAANFLCVLYHYNFIYTILQKEFFCQIQAEHSNRLSNFLSSFNSKGVTLQG